MEDIVDFYLASVWKYKDAGSEYILDGLKEKHPDGHFHYDQDPGWFRVNCSPDNVQAVQATFRDIHAELEKKAMAVEGGLADNAWLREPAAGDLLGVASTLPEEKADTTKNVPVDHLCPVVFDRFACNKVWPRIKNESPASTTVQSFLSDSDRRAVMELSGAHIELDPTGRLVYLGGPSEQSLSKATRMLDNLFRKFTFVLPPPKHMMWSESEGAYTVDARFMAHVNDGMLRSSIFDPGMYPGARLDTMFTDIFGKAACLRICYYDRTRRIEVSYFGPCSEPIFNDQARRWPVWFKREVYTPKVAAPLEAVKAVETAAKKVVKAVETAVNSKTPVADKKPATAQAGQQNGLGNLSQTIDLLTDDVSLVNEPSLDVKPPPAAAAAATSNEETPSSPKPTASNALVPTLKLDATKHGYQLKLLQQFLGDPFKKGSSSSQWKAAKSTAVKAVDNNAVKAEGVTSVPDTTQAEPIEESLISFAEEVVEEAVVALPKSVSAPPAPTIEVVDDTKETINDVKEATAETTDNTDLLIDIPVQAPPEPAVSPRASMALYRPSTSIALVRRTTFANTLCNSIGRLMGDLPYSRGRIRMQVELGRLYLMDTIPEGLASNLPGEPACGWPHTDIMGRLDTVCISPDSVVFSKALTLFANDIESVLGMPGTIGALSLGTPKNPNDIVDIETEDTLPEWSFHDKRIVYELKCERRVVSSTAGVVKVHSPFVVEIDGTMPGAFRYSLRRVDDNRSPIWVHCIQRSWDARVVVSYSQTDILEEEYGEFARELVRTMVVPGGPMTNPRFEVAYDYSGRQQDGQTVYTKVQSARVRNVGRFVSSNGASYLDVSWNRHMKMEMKPDFGGEEDDGDAKKKGMLRFTGAEDDQARGMFGSWYEASVVSAAAEQGFRENETLAVGGMAAWGRSVVDMDNMYEAAFGPALRLVQRMDGVGVLIDNGQGDGKRAVPPMKTRETVAVKNFW